MKYIIIILVCLATIKANGQGINSTKDSVQFLQPLQVCGSRAMTPTTQPITRTTIICTCGWHTNCGVYSGWRMMPGAGTRNLNYLINFVAKNTSIGFEPPHINGARADGNAVFINGIRMESITFLDLCP